ncbi:MAG: C4-dicarboxylate ABC transporter permease, partial [Phascolarctobacterium sp.]
MQNTKDKATEKDVAISTEASAEMQSKSEEIIKKLDKESTTRTFSGAMKKIFFVLCILVSCYHLYTATFGPPLTLIHRSIHVSMMLVLTFLMYPMCKKSSFTTPSILDWILVALSLAAPIYIINDYQGFVERAGNANT